MKEVVIPLKDGGSLAAVIYGDETLRNIVFYFHGFPGSAFEASIAARDAKSKGITLIALERPGYGNSPQRARMSLLDWPEIVREAMNHFGVAAAGILGVSGGGPHALACARQLADRISKVVVVSGVAEVQDPQLYQNMIGPNKWSLVLAKRIPSLGRLIVSLMTYCWRARPSSMIGWYRMFLRGGDSGTLKKGPVTLALEENVRRALRNGSKGALADFDRIVSPWGFSLSDIQCPVVIWHGTEDRYVPYAMGEYLAKNIPGALLKTVPQRGHFMIISTIEKILAEFTLA